MQEAQILLLIGGITECFKIAGIPSKYLPIVAALVGTFIGYVLISHDAAGCFTGTIAGLVTTGIVNRFDYYLEK